jgi:hypothetical protein
MQEYWELYCMTAEGPVGFSYVAFDLMVRVDHNHGSLNPVGEPYMKGVL